MGVMVLSAFVFKLEGNMQNMYIGRARTLSKSERSEEVWYDLRQYEEA